MRGLPRALGLLASSLSLIALTATAAWAPKYLSLTAIDGACTTDDDTGYFTGQFFLTGFADARGSLIAMGEMTGVCDLESANDVVLSQTRSFAAASIVTSSCDILEVGLGDAQARDVTLALEGDLAVFEGGKGAGRLCAIAHQLDKSPADLAALLNRLLL